MAKPFKEDVDVQLIVTIGAVSAILLVVLVFGVQAWFLYETSTENERKLAGAVNQELLDLRSAQQINLNGNRWIDRDKQLAAVRIEDAMQMVIRSGGKLPATQPTK